jgi:uncharacterized membrane protein HdeD (DUF308 family)
MTFQKASSPGWMRFAQIGLGVLAIILSGVAIAFPGLTLLSIVVLVSVVLFFVGIEKIITGLFIAHRSRFASIGLGIMTIILAGLALAFPVAAAIAIIYFLGFALMFDGFARIIDGVTNRFNKGWIRGFLIGVGILNVVIASLVLASPLFGVILAGIMVGISLLIVGIQMVTAGMMGRRQQQQINSQTSFGP